MSLVFSIYEGFEKIYEVFDVGVNRICNRDIMWLLLHTSKLGSVFLCFSCK